MDFVAKAVPLVFRAPGGVGVSGCHGLHNIHSSPAGILLPWAAAARRCGRNTCRQQSKACGDTGAKWRDVQPSPLTQKHAWDASGLPEGAAPFHRWRLTPRTWKPTVCRKTRAINMYKPGKLYNKLSAFHLEAVKVTLPREKESALAENLTMHRHLPVAAWV